MTVHEVIEHLKTLPQDMEVWDLWDESGKYYPLAGNPPGRIDTIAYNRISSGGGWGCYEEVKPGTDGSLKVCVLNQERI